MHPRTNDTTTSEDGDASPACDEAAAREFAEHLALAQSGDAAGWAYLYREHHGPLLSYLRSQAGGEAEDLASEAWVSATRTIGRFTGDARGFRSWLVTIGKRRHIDRLRSQGRRGHHSGLDEVEHRLEGGEDPAAAVERGELAGQLGAALASLGDDEAEVIRLRILAGLDTAHVAEVMGRTPGSVRVLQHRALRKLAARFPTGNDEGSETMDETR